MATQSRRVILLILVGGAMAGMMAHAALSPSAQETVNQALAAIAKEDFPSARVLLEEAEKKGEKAEIYRAMGEAEAKIPGRELRAICWLGAYLSVQPRAADAAQVRQKMETLYAALHKRIAQLTETAEQVAEAIPDASARSYALRSVAQYWGQLGDYERAEKVVNLIPEPGTQSDGFSNIIVGRVEDAQAEAAAGHLAEARKILEEAAPRIPAIPMIPDRSYPQYRLAMGYLGLSRQQLKMGDLTGAQASMKEAQALANGQDRSDYSETERAVATAEISLARTQIKAGNNKEALETLDLAGKIGALATERPNGTFDFLRDLADAQIKAGDAAGARRSLTEALKFAYIYSDAGHARLQVLCEQVDAGDMAGAKETLKLIDDRNDWLFQAQVALAKGAMKMGDTKEAGESLRLALLAAQRAENAERKQQEIYRVALLQARAGDLSAARTTAKLLSPAGGRQQLLDQIEAAVKAGTTGDLDQAPLWPVEFASENLMLNSAPAEEQWRWELGRGMIGEGLDMPWFVSYPDFSNYEAMGERIEKTPVSNGQQPAFRPGDKMAALEQVLNRMIEAERQVGNLLRTPAEK